MFSVLAKLLYRVLFGCGVYLGWSRLYRCWWPKKKKALLPGTATPETLLDRLQHLRWTKDRFWEMGDAIGSPEWVQYCLNEIAQGRAQPKGALDCDEFAAYCAASLPHAVHPVILNVIWTGPKGMAGHNVCLYQEKGPFYYIGNWGRVGPFSHTADVVQDILSRSGSRNSLIGWARVTKNLALIDYGTSLKALV